MNVQPTNDAVYTNHRTDAYGGSAHNRARILGEIITRARGQVGSFPILVKMDGTDYLPGGIDLDSFPGLARAVRDAGIDALEVSGGMWEGGPHCPVPAAAPRTGFAQSVAGGPRPPRGGVHLLQRLSLCNVRPFRPARARHRSVYL